MNSNMRGVIVILFLTISSFSFGQADTATQRFLDDIIKLDGEAAVIYYTDQVGAGIYDHMLKKNFLKKHVKGASSADKGELTLSSEEVNQLNLSLTASRLHKWPAGLFERSVRIAGDSLFSFVSADKSRKLYIFSRPAFMRSNTIALCYVVRLCCGGIYGPQEYSFYRRTNGKWQKWIMVEGGAF
jgi:hypothetical protein